MGISDDSIPVAYEVAKKFMRKRWRIPKEKNIFPIVLEWIQIQLLTISMILILNWRKKIYTSLKCFFNKIFSWKYSQGLWSFKLFLALSALKEHIEYFETERKTKVTLKKLREIYKSYIKSLLRMTWTNRNKLK